MASISLKEQKNFCLELATELRCMKEQNLSIQGDKKKKKTQPIDCFITSTKIKQNHCNSFPW